MYSASEQSYVVLAIYKYIIIIISSSSSSSRIIIIIIIIIIITLWPNDYLVIIVMSIDILSVIEVRKFRVNSSAKEDFNL